MDEIRTKILENYQVQIAASFSCVEILDALYGVTCEGILKPEDVFILSKGHAAPAQYTILAMKGIIKWEDLPKYGPYVHFKAPRMPFTTGSLGCGLGLGVGVSLGKRLKDERGRVYVLAGDGELSEGSIWEAVRFAGEEKLHNLTLLIDLNRKACIHQNVETPNIEVWHNYGWNYSYCAEGHETACVKRECIMVSNEEPTIIECETTKGEGMPELVADPLRHVRRVIDGKIV